MKLDRKKLFFSILLGLIGFVGSHYSLNYINPPFSISIEWCDAMPILASLAFGGSYGLIAATIGLGAFYPFILYANNGWGNSVTTILLVLTYTGVGYVTESRRRKPAFWNHPLIAYPLISLLYNLLFRGLFPIALAFNPPFWYPAAVLSIPLPILNDIVIKSFFILLVLIIFDVYLLNSPAFRTILGLEIKHESRNNDWIILGTFFSSILSWYVLVIFNRVFIDQTFPQGLFTVADTHEILALLVFVAVGFCIGIIICHYIESRLKAEDELIKSRESYRQIFEQF